MSYIKSNRLNLYPGLNQTHIVFQKREIGCLDWYSNILVTFSNKETTKRQAWRRVVDYLQSLSRLEDKVSKTLIALFLWWFLVDWGFFPLPIWCVHMVIVMMILIIQKIDFKGLIIMLLVALNSVWRKECIWSYVVICWMS